MVVKYRQFFFGVFSIFILLIPAFSVFAGCDPVCPVVLVPGMLASFDKKLMYQDVEDNKWGFVPFGNVYKALIKELKMNGYEEGKTLFIAYYDWRKPVDETYKKYLMPKIDEARAKSGKRQVDIVAHSMGGLLSRAYIQSDNYQDDVNKIVMMGTPNKGASEAYVVWEGGIYPSSWNGTMQWFANGIQNSLKRARDKKDIKPPLSFREFFPSLRDVLPTTDFVKRDGELMSLSNMAEKNNFLINLNNNADLIKTRVKDARIYAGLSGKTMDEIVIGGTCTVDDNTNKRWRDGHPNPDPPTADSDEGDETVLLSSATLLDIENYSYEGTSHVKIPDDTRFSIPLFFNPPVLSYLSQPFRVLVQNLLITPSARADESDEYVAPDSMLSFTVSPGVIFEVIDPNGKILSRDKNELGDENANFDDDPEDSGDIILVTIRNPKVGKYVLKITGNTGGDYYVDSTFVNNNGVFDDTNEGKINEGEEVALEAVLSETTGVDLPENETGENSDDSMTSGNDNKTENKTSNSIGPNTSKDRSNRSGAVLGTATVRLKLSQVILGVKNRLIVEIASPSPTGRMARKDYVLLVGPVNDMLARAHAYETALANKKTNVAAKLLQEIKNDYRDFDNKVDRLIDTGKLNRQTANVLTTLAQRLGNAGLR